MKNIINELLKQSCTIMHKTAIDKCYKDYMDEKNGCSWYHMAWQYLRILNCVSAPQWHGDFYAVEVMKEINKKDKLHILISGTADYSLLHILITTVVKCNVLVSIDILDKCQTPLELCKWYIDNIQAYLTEGEKINLQNNVTINYLCKDLFILDDIDKYDIICTDAFLTRFIHYEVPSVLQKWRQLLKDKGKIVTTVRIHEVNKTKNLFDITKDISSFMNKVKRRYEEYIKNEKFPISESELTYLAYRYIVRMKSNNLGNEENISKILNECGFKHTPIVHTVEGEIEETRYLHIVSEVSKND